MMVTRVAGMVSGGGMYRPCDDAMVSATAAMSVVTSVIDLAFSAMVRRVRGVARGVRDDG